MSRIEFLSIITIIVLVSIGVYKILHYMEALERRIEQIEDYLENINLTGNVD